MIANATTRAYHPDVPSRRPDDESVTHLLRQQAWRDLLHAHARLVRRMDEHLAAAGVLSMDDYDVLLALKRAPDRRLRLSDLAERVVLSRSGLTRLVDRIESNGLLRREPSPEDRRGSYAVLTPKGDAALRRTWEKYEPLIIEHFGRFLSAEEAQTLRAIFARVIPPEYVESPPVPLKVR